MKLFFFRRSLWITLAVAGPAAYGALCWRGIFGKADLSFLVTYLGFIASAFYFLQKQKLDEVQVFLKLFSDFNRRFEAMSEDLRRIKDASDAPIENEDKLLAKYLDLCCEEYYFRNHGTIYEDVWRTWRKGMLYCCEAPRIRNFFERELQRPEDYYGLTMAEITRIASGANHHRQGKR